MEIKIERTAHDRRIVVTSPYNAQFVKRARELAGKWNSGNKAWIFPEEMEDQVRALLMDVYGQDDRAPDAMEQLRLRVKLTDYPRDMETGHHLEVVVAGRQVARAFSRDSGARLGQDVVVVSGGFTSGGSRNNPTIVIKDNTEIDLLRLPPTMAARMVEKFPEYCRIVAPDGSELRSNESDTTNVVPMKGNG